MAQIFIQKQFLDEVLEVQIYETCEKGIKAEPRRDNGFPIWPRGDPKDTKLPPRDPKLC